MKVEDGQQVSLGDVLVEWDPYTFAILTEIGGTVQFKDLQEGLTLHEEVDEVTGLSRHVVMDSPDEKRQPAIVLRAARLPSATSCPPALTLWCRMATRSRRAMCSRRFPRDHQDQGHHGRSAARGRIVRSPQAARNRCHQRNRWRGEVRRCQPRASARSTWWPTTVRRRNTRCRAVFTSTFRKASAFALASR